MGRNIGLIIGIIIVGGLGIYFVTRKGGFSILGNGRPPLYSGYGPGAQNPLGPPVGKASFSSTLQDIANVINGGDKVLMAGKNTWDDVKGVFGNEPDTYDTDFVNSLPTG